MSNFIKVFILLSLFLNTLESNTKVFLKNNEIHYNGDLSFKANSKVFELYKNNLKTIKYLSITSKGGEVNNGLDLADFILKNKLSVKVLDYCLSSCANYVFPAGKNKVLGNRALIGFHGGANSREFTAKDIDETFVEEIIKSSLANNIKISKKEAKEQFLSYMNQTSKREQEFFFKINVNKKLSTLGQNKKYLYLEKEGFNAWYYSIKTMQKLGLENISVINGPWKYKKAFKEIDAFEVKVNK
ncbi:MAG: hypothetical protein HRT42_06920 [Campylobacteraceae bacterium]|nr:hypothetical protein [Campylobacteraceae bacterium]